ncbi:L-2-hydroxyglutarate oxidase [Nocardia nova]|uniref:L-2-hydroxyglutarate oxidase n=1 Tax=Nocardia nova TaxID=37330 RepID=UPI001892D428|nr:L-2-hydroxyglutarate oxidase [Nocardia nova]MBF6149214.1 L-2-hydroxyglutarate oxidase [Nocardia nova]MDN2499323.1 L-2-hydroxyglutarate oxidase [Nocardia nova]
MPEQTVGIIGAGIIGLAIGRELVRRRPGTRVVVVDKEDRVAVHQTGHNSGVVHAGIYYEPGSLKAILCARGRQLLRDYCAEKQLPYDEVGKLVVAVTPDDVVRMDALAERAGSNAVPGLRRIDAGEIREIEPHATGLAALHSPHTAITDYPRIAAAFADEITAAGGEIRLSFPVTAVTRASNGIRIGSDAAAIVVDRLIVCAGLHSDTVAGLAGDRPGPRIVPFRGEYMLVRPEKKELVRGLIYPVPDPQYPFLGVHFTRRVNGEVEVGPNAVLAFAREGYRRSAVSARDLRDLATWPGTWRMARRHWRTGVREVHGSLSARAYMRAVQRYVPDIGVHDVFRAGSGVRAQAVGAGGDLVDDFRIHRLGPITAVRNAPSPAATSSMAIAEHVADVLEREGE